MSRADIFQMATGVGLMIAAYAGPQAAGTDMFGLVSAQNTGYILDNTVTLATYAASAYLLGSVAIRIRKRSK